MFDRTSMDATDDNGTIQTRKMLFATNSESSQANTILTIAP